MAKYKTTAQAKKTKSAVKSQVGRKKDLYKKKRKTYSDLQKLEGAKAGLEVFGLGAQFVAPSYQEWEDYDVGSEALGLETEELSSIEKIGRAIKGGPDVKTGGKDLWTDISDSEQGLKHFTTSDIRQVGQYIGADLENQMLMSPEGKRREWTDIVGTMTDQTQLHPDISSMNESLYQSYSRGYAPSMEPQRDRLIYGESWSDKMRGISNVSDRLFAPIRPNTMSVVDESHPEFMQEDFPPMYEGLDTDFTELSETQLEQQQFGYDPHRLLSAQREPRWQLPEDRLQIRRESYNYGEGGVAYTQPQHVNPNTGELQSTPFVGSSNDYQPSLLPDESAPDMPLDQQFTEWDGLSPMPFEGPKKWADMTTFERLGSYLMNRKHYIDPHETNWGGVKSKTLIGDVSKLLNKAGGDRQPVFGSRRRGNW